MNDLVKEFNEKMNDATKACCLTNFYKISENLRVLADVTMPDTRETEEFVAIKNAVQGLDKSLKKSYACGLPSLYDNSEEMRRMRYGSDPVPNQEEFDKVTDLPTVVDKIKSSWETIEKKIKDDHRAYPNNKGWDFIRSSTVSDKAEIHKWVGRLHYMLERNMEKMCKER